jgi:Xaa-Pro aminopeptidase
MAFTVEPGLYMAADKANLSLSHASYDADERLRLTFELGAVAAKAEIARREAEAGYLEFAVPQHFLGIGVRIEDDLLITSEGCENLTALAPVDPQAVEATSAQQSSLPLFG